MGHRSFGCSAGVAVRPDEAGAVARTAAGARRPPQRSSEEVDYTLRLPDLPDLNDSYDRALTLIRTGVRVGDEAVFAPFVHAPCYSSVAIRLAERSEIVREVFGRRRSGHSERGWSCSGCRCTAAGRSSAACESCVRQVCACFSARAKWRNGQAALGEIKRSGLPDLEHWSEGDVLTALLERRALVSALKIQCPRCQMHARYGLDLISEEMRCPRCRNVFAPAPLLLMSRPGSTQLPASSQMKTRRSRSGPPHDASPRASELS